MTAVGEVYGDLIFRNDLNIEAVWSVASGGVRHGCGYDLSYVLGKRILNVRLRPIMLRFMFGRCAAAPIGEAEKKA